VVVVELFEYNVSIERVDPSSPKRAKDSLFSECCVPGSPKQLKEVAFFDWEEALRALEVERELLGIRGSERSKESHVKWLKRLG
jgi:hypothetical protein